MNSACAVVSPIATPIAAIPLIALVPLFALGHAETTMDFKSAVLAILTIFGVIVVGRFLLSRLYRFVAATGVDLHVEDASGEFLGASLAASTRAL